MQHQVEFLWEQQQVEGVEASSSSNSEESLPQWVLVGCSGPAVHLFRVLSEGRPIVVRVLRRHTHDASHKPAVTAEVMVGARVGTVLLLWWVHRDPVDPEEAGALASVLWQRVGATSTTATSNLMAFEGRDTSTLFPPPTDPPHTVCCLHTREFPLAADLWHALRIPNFVCGLGAALLERALLSTTQSVQALLAVNYGNETQPTVAEMLQVLPVQGCAAVWQALGMQAASPSLKEALRKEVVAVGDRSARGDLFL